MPTNLVQRLALGSIAIAVAVLLLKLLAWRLTGSAALYSDAIESLVNVAAAVAAYLAVMWANRPADRNHPYGHHKAEYLSAVFEGALIVLAALAVLRAAWTAWLAPQALTEPALGLATNGLASLLNAGWAVLLMRVGRREGSPALIADGRHLMADVASSVAVLGGLVLVVVTRTYVLDALLAGIVGVYILWAGWRLVIESVGGLMDEATPPEVAERIGTVITAAGDGALQAHDVRTRRAGRATFIDFHLVVPGTLSVSAAHDICDRIEAALRAEIPGSITTIHVEPDHKAKSRGAMTIA